MNEKKIRIDGIEMFTYIDAAIATRIMGWKDVEVTSKDYLIFAAGHAPISGSSNVFDSLRKDYVPSYSKRDDLVCDVITRMLRKGFSLNLFFVNGEYSAVFEGKKLNGMHVDKEYATAICIAALHGIGYNFSALTEMIAEMKLESTQSV